MEENILNIFTSYLASLVENKSFDLNDLWYIAEQFKPVCEQIKTRQDLISFIEPFLKDYPEFQDLKNKLQDENYIFKF